MMKTVAVASSGMMLTLSVLVKFTIKNSTSSTITVCGSKSSIVAKFAQTGLALLCCGKGLKVSGLETAI